MRYLFLILFFSTTAFAEWIPLKLILNTYYDNSSVELMNDMKFRVYSYTNLPQSQMKSIEMQIEFDCRDRSYRDLVQTFYMEQDLKGEKIGNTKLDTSVKYPPRDTNIESMLNEICVNVLAPDKAKVLNEKYSND
jgi:hypothetical protein